MRNVCWLLVLIACGDDVPTPDAGNPSEELVACGEDWGPIAGPCEQRCNAVLWDEPLGGRCEASTLDGRFTELCSDRYAIDGRIGCCLQVEDRGEPITRLLVCL